MENKINCVLCGLECSMQVSASHLRVKHNMTTKEYRALGHATLSEARLSQLRQSPVGSGEIGGSRDQHGPNHWNWKGGHIDGNGYKITYRNGKRGVEHRLIAEEMLDRPLTHDEAVHHKDGNRLNNAPDNLVVMTKREHDRMTGAKLRRERFSIPDECVQAAHILKSHEWSNAMIARALQVAPEVVKNWLTGTTRKSRKR